MPHSPCHQRRLANCDWMPASYTSGQSSCSRRHPTCKASRKGATLSLARRAMEPGHLLHSAHTCPPSGNAGLSKLDIHLYPLHNNSSVHLTTITEVWRSGRGTDEMTKGWIALWDPVLSSPTSAPALLDLPRTACVRINTLRTSVRHFHSCLHKWSMAASANCECRAEYQVKPLTMLSFNVQSIDFPMDCTTWRFWMIR